MTEVKAKKDYKRIIILASCYFVVLLLVGVLIFSFVVFSIAKSSEEDEGVLATTVVDDRLSDLGIDEGDLILAEKSFDDTKIQVGDVITFAYYGEDGSYFVTAKVTQLIAEPNSIVPVTCYKVSGQDEYVHPMSVEAVYSLGGEKVGKHYVGIGGMLDFMRSAWGYIVFVVVPAVLALGIVATTIVYDFYYQKNKKAQDETTGPALEETDAQNA